MDLDIISYKSISLSTESVLKEIETALFNKGIIGIKNVPHFEMISFNYINAARAFSKLDEKVKKQYTPNRDLGEIEGYELGAEQFKNGKEHWKVDDKKSSYYARVPDHPKNKWPKELNLRTAYLELGELIFNTGKLLLNAISLNETLGVTHKALTGYGRMLHYREEENGDPINPDWCGAHTDHGIFTGLIPAYYFKNGLLVEEPEEAGLYISPTHKNEFEKVRIPDRSILLFQVGDFSQLILNDRIQATKHLVKKPNFNSIERFSFALFYMLNDNMTIQSRSILNQDPRYKEYQTPDGKIRYSDWEKASHEYYRAK